MYAVRTWAVVDAVGRMFSLAALFFVQVAM
jgi:hypothetical protein